MGEDVPAGEVRHEVREEGREGFVGVLAACFAIATAGLAVIARPALALPALVAVAFVVGWAVFGGRPAFRAAAVPALLSAAAILALRWTRHGGGARRAGVATGP